jgi:hypothetical protein
MDSVPSYSAMLWIRIGFNADPDLGCDDLKLSNFTAENYDFLDAGGPSYRRIFQPLKENIPSTSKHDVSLSLFSAFASHFCPPGSESSRQKINAHQLQ